MSSSDGSFSASSQQLQSLGLGIGLDQARFGVTFGLDHDCVGLTLGHLAGLLGFLLALFDDKLGLLG